MAAMRVTKKHTVCMVGALCLAGIVVGMLTIRWYRTYHLPMKQVRPILQNLQPDSSRKELKQSMLWLYGNLYDADQDKYVSAEHLKPLKGIAAEKVKQRVLKLLSAPRNPQESVAVSVALLIVMKSLDERVGEDVPATGLNFSSESDWQTIREGAQWNNNLDNNNLRFQVERREDGSYRLRMASSRYHYDHP